MEDLMPAASGPTQAPRTPLLTRRSLLRGAVRLGIGGSAGLAGGICWGTKEPHWIDVERHEFILPRLPRAFDGFRLVHISDFHVDSARITDRVRLQQIVQRTNALHPDAVLLTGDYVTHRGREWPALFAAGFTGLTAPVCAAVLGNHDHWSEAGPVRAALRKCGVRELLNDTWTVQRGKDRLHLCGLDDPYGTPDLEGLVRKVPRDECAVLMLHQPDLADGVSATGAFDLQLSGHSHGGQVRIPGYGALLLPGGGVKYNMGHYQIGEMQLYTTRGVGTLSPTVRFNCRPEITHITLRAA